MKNTLYRICLILKIARDARVNFFLIIYFLNHLLISLNRFKVIVI